MAAGVNRALASARAVRIATALRVGSIGACTVDERFVGAANISRGDQIARALSATKTTATCNAIAEPGSRGVAACVDRCRDASQLL
jgi:hypothetical protein